MFQERRATEDVVYATIVNLIGLLAVIGIVITACAQRDQLVVSSRPNGATVLVDGEEKGKTPLKLRLEPGEHLVSLSLEHYMPWEEMVSIEEGEVRRIEPTLLFVPYTTPLAEAMGKLPAWSSDGSRVYFIQSTAEGDRVAQVEVEQPSEESELLSIDGRVLTRGSWSSDGRQLLAISSTDGSRGLFIFDLSSGEQSKVYQEGGEERFLTVSNFDAIATWGAEREVYFVLYRLGPNWGADNPYDLIQEVWWSGRDRTELKMLYDFPFPVLSSVAWAPSGGLLLEKYDGLLRTTASDIEPLPLVDSGVMKASEWAPDGSRIAYLWVEEESEPENTLSVLDMAGDHTEELIRGNLTHFHWMPDSKQLVYFAYSALTNSSSCWAVDVETGDRILLADSGVLGQLVSDFAISPDGKRIAFEGEDGNIWLLTLSE